VMVSTLEAKCVSVTRGDFVFEEVPEVL